MFFCLYLLLLNTSGFWLNHDTPLLRDLTKFGCPFPEIHPPPTPVLISELPVSCISRDYVQCYHINIRELERCSDKQEDYIDKGQQFPGSNHS